MNIRMICMDLDGTALQKDRKTFSPRLIAALEQAHKLGIAIVPVTGRQYGLLPPAVKGHPVWENLVVTCNGGQVRKLATGEVLYRLDIPWPVLPRLLELAAEYDLPIEFSVDSRLHLTQHSLELQKSDPGLAFHLETILPACGQVVDSLESICSLTVEKVNLLCIPDDCRREEIEKRLSRMDISAVYASHNSLEITHRDANKGNGLRQLCRLLDIPMECVMALGDSGNDESMLRLAGLGVAMGNGPERIKAVSDAVTETNEKDGAAAAIERYALKM